MFAPDELIAALSDGGVEYVLIGGLAVGAHGFPRATKHLARGAVITSLGDRPMRVCSREDLVAMKRAAGRSQDLVDLEQLGES